MGTEIRPMEKSDLAFVHRGLSETNWQDIPSDQKAAVGRRESDRRVFADFERFSRDKRFKFKVFVAQSDDKQPVGYVSVGELMNPAVGLPLGAVLDFWVEPRHRNQGIGTELLDYALDFLRSKRYKFVSIMVSARNERAMRMYQKRGFKADRINLVKKLP